MSPAENPNFENSKMWKCFFHSYRVEKKLTAKSILDKR